MAAPNSDPIDAKPARKGAGRVPAEPDQDENGARKALTGVAVNAHPNIDRKTYDHLKALIHACGRPDDPRLEDAAFRASLLGKIGWVATLNPARGNKLRRLLAKAWDRRFPG